MILSRAIEALKELIQRGSFTEIPRSKEKLQEMLHGGCNIFEWASTHLEEDSHGQQWSFSELYRHYREAMISDGEYPTGKINFGRKLKRALTGELIKCKVG